MPPSIPPESNDTNHGLRKELGFGDLIPMQVLLTVGLTWAGNAAREGSTHVILWLAGTVLLFLPITAVVQYCVRLWPLEGGVYQWTRHALGPFAGFLSAWNLFVWSITVVSTLGITVAASISYSLGPRYAWVAESNWAVAGLNIVLFAFILGVNIPGLGIGRWVAHFGTAVTLLVTALLLLLIVYHPHATAAHPHHSPQRPFSLAFPAVTLLTLNLFSKLSFYGLSGIEQAAVFAGETRDPARSIMRAAWIAAPLIAAIYICMSGSMLTYTPADQIDLTAPIPQVLAAGFGTGSASGFDAGLYLGRIAILLLAMATIAQYSLIVAETSRLPMVAAWDHLLPAWFMRLHPRYRTPTRSLLVFVAVALLFSLLASVGAGAQEAFQILTVAGNVCYAIYYLMMFTVPLTSGGGRGPRPGVLLSLACLSGILMSFGAIMLSFFPIVDVTNAGLFAVKIALSTLVINSLGMLLYRRGAARRHRDIEAGLLRSDSTGESGVR
jgi:amino acid transporter